MTWIDYWPLPWLLYGPMALRVLVAISLAIAAFAWLGRPAAPARRS